VWPPAPLSEAQIEEVRACELETLSEERYPNDLQLEELAGAFEPETSCDWATLAFAYTPRLTYGEDFPTLVIEAYTQAVEANRGFALATPLYFWYFGQAPLAPAPPVSNQTIVAVELRYRWSGLGEPVDYEAVIREADATPILETTPKDLGASSEASDAALIQALGAALTDLVPIDSDFSLIPCYDNYPEWTVTLTFADGTRLDLWTDSNYLFFGGPWFTEIDEQIYLQGSTAFAEALHEFVTALKLPIGEPGAMSCFGDEVFDKAFPR
jgi:hypothetical protein